jgi:hypothetical protein
MLPLLLVGTPALYYAYVCTEFFIDCLFPVMQNRVFAPPCTDGGNDPRVTTKVFVE